MDAPQPAPIEAPAPAASPVAAVLAILGGLLVILGSTLTWFSVTADASALNGGSVTVSVKGMDGDGKITLIAGIVLVILGGLMYAMRGRNMTAISIIALLGGVVAALVAIYDITTAKSTGTDSVANAIASQPHGPLTVDQIRQVLSLISINVSVEIGVIMVAVAGIVGAVGGALGIRASRLAATPTGAVAVSPPPDTPPSTEPGLPTESTPPATPPVDQPPTPPASDEGTPPTV